MSVRLKSVLSIPVLPVMSPYKRVNANAAVERSRPAALPMRKVLAPLVVETLGEGVESLDVAVEPPDWVLEPEPSPPEGVVPFVELELIPIALSWNCWKVLVAVGLTANTIPVSQ